MAAVHTGWLLRTIGRRRRSRKFRSRPWALSSRDASRDAWFPQVLPGTTHLRKCAMGARGYPNWSRCFGAQEEGDAPYLER
ncbi:hypothetical protein CSUI_006177 [Cystoisospora suis]|uniref:Uncharacterized protein n=1 Tax=Cystoisospora suis TaxID=483139 RepID=A0A2C6K204_9APIC|nr:hypothetical protein CSUI_006177 [Cystoisospora suis]